MSNGPVGGPGCWSSSSATASCRCTSRSSARSARASRPAALRPERGCPRAARWPKELGISRGVVTEAYSQLAAEGYLLSRQGAPVRVARTVRTSGARPPARSLLPSFPYHFHPGLPDLAGFPRDRWLRSLRAAWRQAPIDAVGYPDPRGVPGAATGARRLPGPRARRRRRARADADLHRLRPGLLAALPLAGGLAASSGSRSRIPAGTRTA